MRNKIIIISGDPNSINSEIIYKSWKKINKSLKKKIYLISNVNLIKKQLKKLNINLKLNRVKNIYENNKIKGIKIIDVKINFKDPFKVSKKSSSNFVIKSLDLAHKLAHDKSVKGIINCAIDKTLLNSKNLGVTEYLAAKCKVKDESEVMLIANKKLAVCPITTHINLKDVSKKITIEKIYKKIKSINIWFKKKYRRKPRIAILGLNPHNSEFVKDSEEIKVILPSIRRLKKSFIKIDGPLSADTLFINDFKYYDVIVGMYHDQILTPFKTLYKFDAINITLGLNYPRVSPDHGTAKELIGKNRANEESLINCLNYIDRNY